MNIFVFCVLHSLIPFLHADPSPDTIQIQNYDGPIFLHSPKLNCCPLCNSQLTPQKPTFEPDTPCDFAIPEEYLRNPLGVKEVPISNSNLYGTSPANAYTPIPSGNQCATSSGNTNLGTILHTNAGKAGITYSVPLTSGSTYTPPPANSYSGSTVGNAYTASPYETTFNSHTGPGIYGNPLCAPQPTITATECTCITKPLSSYMPINTSPNTCSYKLPIVVGNNQVFGTEDEPMLVPQKFSYSLILDGEVAPTFSQNGPCDYRCYGHC